MPFFVAQKRSSSKTGPRVSPDGPQIHSPPEPNNQEHEYLVELTCVGAMRKERLGPSGGKTFLLEPLEIMY